MGENEKGVKEGASWLGLFGRWIIFKKAEKFNPEFLKRQEEGACSGVGRCASGFLGWINPARCCKKKDETWKESVKRAAQDAGETVRDLAGDVAIDVIAEED